MSSWRETIIKDKGKIFNIWYLITVHKAMFNKKYVSINLLIFAIGNQQNRQLVQTKKMFIRIQVQYYKNNQTISFLKERIVVQCN